MNILKTNNIKSACLLWKLFLNELSVIVCWHMNRGSRGAVFQWRFIMVFKLAEVGMHREEGRTGEIREKKYKNICLWSIFPRILSHGSRWSIPRVLGLRKQLLLGPYSNKWGHSTSLHKFNGRNQWVPLCLNAWTLMSTHMPHAGLLEWTGKNNTTHFETLKLQINGKIIVVQFNFKLPWIC